MPDAPPTPATPHLFAALIALTVVLVLVVAVTPSLERYTQANMERAMLANLEESGRVPPLLGQRNQGMMIQRYACAQKDVLPVFGSSELSEPVPNRAGDFFRNRPTGFQVCPIGKAGSTCLMIAQKLGALGEQVRGKKIVVIVSFAWFRHNTIEADNYAGNFSPLQASEMLLNDDLGVGLRKRLAERMEEFPDTLKSRPLLAASVNSVGREAWWTRLQHSFLKPVLAADVRTLSWMDNLATACALMEAEDRPPKFSAAKVPVEWAQLIADEEKKMPANDGGKHNLPEPDEPDSKDFMARIDSAREWQDFALLLDTLDALKCEPLIFSMPQAGVWDDNHGVSRAARDVFYKRVEEMCAAHHYPCSTFSDHDLDTAFIIGRSSHLTEKGWVYVNRLLDDFYHDRLPPAKPSGA